MKKLCKILALSFIMASCSSSFNKKEYYAFLNDADNGYVVKRKVGDKQITGKYLPMEYMILRDISNGGKNYIDSVKNRYSDSRTFLLTIEGIEKDRALIYNDLSDYKEYQERIYTLNFDMKEFFSLKTSTENYKPVLVTAENTYGLQKSLNLVLVFAKKNETDDLMNSDKYDLVFNDEVFRTGINHFVFYRSNIDKEVKLKIES